MFKIQLVCLLIEVQKFDLYLSGALLPVGVSKCWRYQDFSTHCKTDKQSWISNEELYPKNYI